MEGKKIRLKKEATGKLELPAGRTRYVTSETKSARRAASLRPSRDRYYSLFENVPISLWEEDFSAVKALIDDLRRQGVRDFRKYFEDNPAAVSRCVEMVRIVDVNQVTLSRFEAMNKGELKKGLGRSSDWKPMISLKRS